MSFDAVDKSILSEETMSQSLSIRAMSFDRREEEFVKFVGLNPFRSGRCLSTVTVRIEEQCPWSLNPFRSGRCLSTIKMYKKLLSLLSQSLSIRAMSFDDNYWSGVHQEMGLNPFRSGRCLSTFIN